MTSLDIHLERLLDGSPERAFAAWTDPGARQVWYQDQPGTQVEASTDLRVGGRWTVRFGEYGEEGVFEVVDPPHRLVYTSTFQRPDGSTFDTRITVTFEPRDGKTLMTVVDAGFPDTQTRDLHEGGWPGFLDRYSAIVAEP